MEKPRVLVADDKENMLTLLERILGDAYEVITAADGGRALSLVAAEEFDVVLTDIRMPGADGFEVLQAVKSRRPDTEVVLMTAFASVPRAVEAMRQGAYDYLQKPFDPDDVALVISRALERKRHREHALDLRKEARGVFGFHRLIGHSPAMQEVYKLIERAASLDITVLLTGESGTGKELAARAIHYESSRKGNRFVAVNCGALPGELVESELFGHARGAFTGAAAAKPGLFEEAQGGSIFLDEIGDVPLAVQVKLNRALQEKEVRRVGENAPMPIDARVIAATHRDLKADAQTGRFREDLFYRLNVFPIRLPPLRERQEDIPFLAAHFLEKYGRAHQRPIAGFEPEALRALAAYGWPGNVRELENAIERAVAVAAGPQVTPADLPPELHQRHGGPLPAGLMVRLPYREAVDLARDRASREYLIALLKEFRGNVTRAAERAGMERESLHRLLKRYGIHSDAYKHPEGM
jgi:DNA-binding NtrC family response regulator